MKLRFVLRIVIARRILFAVTFDVVIRILSTPLANSASASLTFAVQTPIAPAASCSLAIAGHLCVLACGRVATPVPASFAFIVARFCSSLSRSTHSAGVSRSHFETPIPGTSRSLTGLFASVAPSRWRGAQTVIAPQPAVRRKPRRVTDDGFI